MKIYLSYHSLKLQIVLSPENLTTWRFESKAIKLENMARQQQRDKENQVNGILIRASMPFAQKRRNLEQKGTNFQQTNVLVLYCRFARRRTTELKCFLFK